MAFLWKDYQIRAVDPFHSYKSSEVNRLTYAISENGRGVIFGMGLSLVNNQTFSVDHGVTLKDNAIIKWNPSFNLNLSDLPSYPFSSGTYFVVQVYKFIETEIENYKIAKIDFVQTVDPEWHLILGRAVIDSNGDLTSIDNTGMELANAITNHNGLFGLEGGGSGHYYHLDQCWYDCLTCGCLNGGDISTSSIGDLCDVNITGATCGQSICFNGTEFVPYTPSSGSGVNSFLDLCDTENSYPAENYIPIVNSTVNGLTFINKDEIITNASFDMLCDVNVTGATCGQSICFDGSNWVTYNPSSGGGVTSWFDLCDTPTGVGTYDNEGLVTVYNMNGCCTLQFIERRTVLASSTFNDIGDVNVCNATNGQSICFDGSNWIPYTPSGGSATLNLNDLGDVDTTGVSDGYIISYEASSCTWKAIANSGGSGITELNDLCDVCYDTCNITDNEVLIWSGYNNRFINNKLVLDGLKVCDFSGGVYPKTLLRLDPSSAGTSADRWVSLVDFANEINLNDLGDVNVGSATCGQSICFDGSNWVTYNPSSGSLPSGTVGKMLVHDGTDWVSTNNIEWNETAQALCINGSGYNYMLCLSSNAYGILVNVSGGSYGIMTCANYHGVESCTCDTAINGHTTNANSWAVVGDSPNGYDFVACGSGKYATLKSGNIVSGYTGIVDMGNGSCLDIVGGIIVGVV